MRSGPLAGFSVGVTADRRADEQIQLLEGRGARCIHGPVIRTHPLGPEDALRRATLEVIEDPPEITVLTTGIGVRSWLEAADAMQLGHRLRAVLLDTTLIVRGPKAAGAAVTAGFDVAWSAPTARYDDITTMLAERGVLGCRVAVQLDGAEARDLCGSLRSLGADLVPVPVYRWSLPDDTTAAERLVRAVCDGRIDGLTFTARPAVENFLTIAAHIGLADELGAALTDHTACFCVGPVCAAGVTDAGLPPPHTPARTRLGAMVQLMSAYFSARAVEVTLAGIPVRVQGRLVEIRGVPAVSLTEREQSLLDVLIERPGVVHSKRALLRRVWGPDESDEHVVEVTIGRLRHRLGPAGVGVETVIRRGYRASAV